MARLNEAPVAPGPSTETIEAVKRRFLRQNRELAKINSQQSIRIRSLENDASRLLAENLSLREQALHLQNALESAELNRPSLENIDTVRDQLQAKIEELGLLVSGLGQLQKTQHLPRCKSQTVATKRSPDERQWRSGLGLQDVQNAMLPTITEGKFFPRKTMNEDELQNILDYPDSQSPDIGPPPISRFDSDEPISYNAHPTLGRQGEDLLEGCEPPLSANLETRKKRRESGPKLDLRHMAVFQSPPREDPVAEPTKPVRAGAKRKFNVQDDRDKADGQTEPFSFSRRNASSNTNGGEPLQEEVRPVSPERPILGSKPVNTDPIVSPKKQRPSTMPKLEKRPSTISKPANSHITITRKATQELHSIDTLAEQRNTVEINRDSLLPKTPAVNGIVSPPSTEPSTTRPDSKDTPPPVDIGSCDQTGLNGRPSRRVRAQVSYKEPALNVKMRRPGKELVDAVQLPADKKVSMGSQFVSSTSEITSSKQEPVGSSSAWNLSSGGSIEEDSGSPLRQKLDRREGIQGIDSGTVVEPPKSSSSAASNAISVLLNASSSKRRTSKSLTATTMEVESDKPPATAKPIDTVGAQPLVINQEERDDLAIFDFNESSPIETKAPINPSNTINNSRRHSTALPSASTELRKPELEPKMKMNGTLPPLCTRMGNGCVRGAVSSRGVAKEKRPQPLPTSGSTMDLNVTAAIPNGTNPSIPTKGSGSLRAERAASRRKSMML